MEGSENFPPETGILLIDDSPIAQESLTKELNALGYRNIKRLKNGTEAQQFMQGQGATTIHLIFSDIHMPSMTGLVFLSWLRAQPNHSEMPVIMLTSSADKSDLLEAIKQKVSQYLLKPFTVDSLTAKMSATWKKQGQKYFESLRRPA